MMEQICLEETETKATRLYVALPHICYFCPDQPLLFEVESHHVLMLLSVAS